jgi:hypothetical protein
MASTNYSWDLASGQDAAHKMGQEQSALKAKQMADLYDMDIGSVMASTNRIRDIQKYLQAGGYDGTEVIPRQRMAGISHTV